MKFLRFNEQTQTNWYEIINGVQFKSTPSHGWLVLASYKLLQMKREHPELVLTQTCNGNITNYEEDCEINLALLAFWKELPAEFNLESIVKAVAYWYPAMFTQWVAKCIQTGEIKDVLDVLPADFHVKFMENDTLFDKEPLFTDYVDCVNEYMVEIA